MHRHAARLCPQERLKRIPHPGQPSGVLLQVPQCRPRRRTKTNDSRNILPDLKPYSCPPPNSKGEKGAPALLYRHPIPLGPWNLCADTEA